jgi:hypothetical protein
MTKMNCFKGTVLKRIKPDTVRLAEYYHRIPIFIRKVPRLPAIWPTASNRRILFQRNARSNGQGVACSDRTTGGKGSGGGGIG